MYNIFRRIRLIVVVVLVDFFVVTNIYASNWVMVWDSKNLTGYVEEQSIRYYENKVEFWVKIVYHPPIKIGNKYCAEQKELAVIDKFANKYATKSVKAYNVSGEVIWSNESLYLDYKSIVPDSSMDWISQYLFPDVSQ